MDSLSTKPSTDKPPQPHPLLASGVLKRLPSPTAAVVSSGGESDSDVQPPGHSVKFGDGRGGSDDTTESAVSLQTTIATGAANSSGGSGDEGGGGGGGRRETKRKLLEALEEFAPKRRSSRVSEMS